MAEELQFNILLDKIKGGIEGRGLRLGGGDLKAARFYREGRKGVADSVQAVQEAGLLQVPFYAYVQGRSFVGLDDPVWTDFHDSLAERLTLKIDKSYDGIPKLKNIVVDIVGGGLFMPQHELIRNVDCGGPPYNFIKIASYDKDLLLGERHVYRWNGKKLEQVPVKYFFTSFAEFDDVSGTLEFQKALNDLSAVYVVLRSVREARKNPSDYKPITEQLNNPDLIIPCGNRARLNRMLMEAQDKKKKQVPRFKWKKFNSRHDGYKYFDTGLVSVLGGGTSCDVVKLNNFGFDGASGGVAPEALEAWREAHTSEKESLEKKV